MFSCFIDFMKGLYLYCIRNNNGKGLSAKGIDGKSKATSIPYKDIEAIVSKIDLKEFDSKEIVKKAKEDLEWITAHAQRHEDVIEEAMRADKEIIPVIPMKFGAIFKTEKNLEGVLKKNYHKFKKTLKKFEDKQEQGLKVYLDRKLLEKEVKKVSPTIIEKEKEIAHLPEGIAYLMQKEADEVVSEEVDCVLEKYIADIFEGLKSLAGNSVKGKILEKEFTGKTIPMILNASFLVSENKLKDFQKKVDELSEEYKHRGLHFEHTGPWPPYNFV